MGVWYATREDVKSALDIMETARNDAQVDRAIEGSSRAVEGLTHRRFYPELATRYFDWPNDQYTKSWRLWLDSNEVISGSQLVSGGTTISASDYDLRRSDDLNEPPYTYLELDLASNATFSAGPTHQRSVALTGLYGYRDDTSPAGSLAEALDASETLVDVTDGGLVGIGHLLLVESERMIVTGRELLATETVTGAGLSESNANVLVPVNDASIYHQNEIITVDAERMRIIDIAGNNLIVKRAWDGSVLAAHTAGSTIYASRRLTVQRGVLGTTAATHADTTAIVKTVYPGLVNNLCVAYSLNELLQESSGFARSIGTGDAQREFSGRGIKELEDDVKKAVGRQMRSGTV